MLIERHPKGQSPPPCVHAERRDSLNAHQQETRAINRGVSGRWKEIQQFTAMMCGRVSRILIQEKKKPTTQNKWCSSYARVKTEPEITVRCIYLCTDAEGTVWNGDQQTRDDGAREERGKALRRSAA